MKSKVYILKRRLLREKVVEKCIRQWGWNCLEKVAVKVHSGRKINWELLRPEFLETYGGNSSRYDCGM